MQLQLISVYVVRWEPNLILLPGCPHYLLKSILCPVELFSTIVENQLTVK